MKFITLLTITIFLFGCAGSQTKQARLDKKARPCLETETKLEKAMSCLKDNGYKKWREYKSTYIYDSCGMYWGYPLVASCSYIFIEHGGGEIKSYKIKAELDGV